MLRNKKGVSPVIAVVLMIVVAVAISLVVYVWATGFVSEKTGAETKAGDYSFLVETKGFEDTNIRNMGNSVFIAESSGSWKDGFLVAFDVYVNDALNSSAISEVTLHHDGSAPQQWSKGRIITIVFDDGEVGSGDKIKLVHKDSGTPIVFKLE
jgi:flagellin-like protein